MLKKVALGLILLIVSFIGIILITFQSNLGKTYTVKEFEVTPEEVNATDIELGKRIYQVRAGCVDCHGVDLAGKKVMENGAIGTIYGANITPFNLKSWSDKEIVKAIRYGVHKSGRSLRFMPSFDYEGYSKGDLLALVKYLRSQNEVQTPSHENSFGPIAKMLSSFNKMPVMFPAKFIDLNKDFATKPAEEITPEFGKYLANACIGCHGSELRGGPIPGGDPNWPEATNIRLGANSNWSKEKFSEMIKTGISPTTKKEIRPPMPIWLLKEYNDKEIEALWLYLSAFKN